MKRLIVGMVVMLNTGLLISTADASIFVSSWGLKLFIRDSGDEASADNDIVSLPLLSMLTATTIGGTESTASYDFMVNGDAGSFNFDFDHYRSGVSDSQNIAAGDIFFTVTEPSSFDIDGLFSLDGGGRIRADIQLRDLTISSGGSGRIYRSLQQSLNTQDEVFELGGMGGDDSNDLIGNLLVALVPGHQYLFDYNFDIVTLQEDVGANANGFVGFTITPGLPPDISAVPEPTSFIIWSLLVLATVGISGRRNRLIGS